MSGYIIAQINVKNIENYQEYLKRVTAIAKKYEGEYIVRAGNFEIMEGVSRLDDIYDSRILNRDKKSLSIKELREKLSD